MGSSGEIVWPNSGQFHLHPHANPGYNNDRGEAEASLAGRGLTRIRSNFLVSFDVQRNLPRLCQHWTSLVRQATFSLTFATGANMRHNWMALTVVLAFLSISFSAGQDRDLSKLTPTGKGSRLDPLVASEIKLLQAGGKPKSGSQLATAKIAAQPYAVLNMEFDDEAACRRFTSKHPHVLTQYDSFADIFIPASDEAVQAAQAEPGVRWIDVARIGIVPPLSKHIVTDDTPKSPPEPAAQGGVDGLTGKGVTIAILDSGIDFRHPDFITTDLQGNKRSRLLYLWDTFQDPSTLQVGKPAPISYPGGAPVGTIYSRAELSAALNGTGKNISETDIGGHGTGCASIAAGNGAGAPDRGVNKTNYKGVAPDADLIAVRIGQKGGVENAYLLGAILHWLEEIHRDRPLVISCSFGGQYGGRDGYQVAERQMAARFAKNPPGRIICFAAGNEGQRAIHARADLQPQGKSAQLKWHAPGIAEVSLYFQTDDISKIDCRIADNTSAKFTAAGKHNLTQQYVARISAESGDGEIILTNNGERDVIVDGYIAGETDAEGKYARFFGETVAVSEQVASPGTADAVITVGSYDWNDTFHINGKQRVIGLLNETNQAMAIGSLSDYSNPGFLRFGKTIKPEIVAPGRWFTAAAPLNKEVKVLRDTTGQYQLFDGTSAATPYTAGVIALLLQKNPRMTIAEAKTKLANAATRPAGLSTLPSKQWGYGKLDIAAVKRLVKSNP